MNLTILILRIQSETKMDIFSYCFKNLFQEKKKYYEGKLLLDNFLTKRCKQKSKEHYK